METKNIITYIFMAAIAFIAVSGIVNLTNVSTGIKESNRMLDSVKLIVRDSREIISQQALTLVQLQKMNKDLYLKVVETDSINRVLKAGIDTRLSNTNRTIKDIKVEIEKINVPVIH